MTAKVMLWKRPVLRITEVWFYQQKVQTVGFDLDNQHLWVHGRFKGGGLWPWHPPW